jgi:hypothetical protein
VPVASAPRRRHAAQARHSLTGSAGPARSHTAAVDWLMRRLGSYRKNLFSFPDCLRPLMAKKPIPTASEQFAAQVHKLVQTKTTATELYKEAAKLEESLLETLADSKPSKRLLPDGRVVGVKDNFAKANTCWKNARFQRFEVEVLG